MMDFPVSRRLAHRFGISIGGDEMTFKVCGFTAEERLSEPFVVTVDLTARDRDVDFDRILEQDAVLFVRDEGAGGGEPRYFHGIVTAFRQTTVSVKGLYGHALYTATIEPRIALMRHSSDSRIFQGQTVPEIVNELLHEIGIDDQTWFVTRKFPKVEFLCQYNETNFDFMQRILAENGIWWRVTHEKDKHIVEFATLNRADMKIDVKEMLYEGSPGGDAEGAFVYRFMFSKALGSGHAAQKDYTFKNPKASLYSRVDSELPRGVVDPQYGRVKPDETQEERDRSRRLYRFPGRYKNDAVGKVFTQVWLEAERALLAKGEGQSNIHQLCPGGIVKLTGYRKSLDGPYLLVGVRHEGTQPQALEEGAGDEEPATYNNSFLCVPESVPYRPLRRVKPVMDGPQMCVVTGPEGEEIYTDEFNRIRVKFPWDRLSKENDTSSCWIRVTQAWAGPMFGNIAIPRIGQEVLVEFLDGDIDQPIVTGRGYHATNLAPYKLPDNKTKMVIRSKTHKGDGFNQLSFEDEKGKEEVFVHAERDMNIEVKYNKHEYVGNLKGNMIQGSCIEQIGMLKISTTGFSNIENIGGDKVINVGMAQMIEDSFSSEFKHSALFGAYEAMNVSGSIGNFVLNCGSSIEANSLCQTQFYSGGSFLVRSQAVMSLNSKGNAIINSGSQLLMESDKDIIIKCGLSSIILHKSGKIMFSGVSFKFYSGDVNIEAANSIILKAVKINLN